MPGLLDIIRSAITPGAIDTLGTRLGEPQQATGSALNGAVAAVLAALATKVEGGGGSGIVSAIKAALAGGNPLDHPGGLAPGAVTGAASGPFGEVLGSGFGTTAAALARHFGIKADSAQTLLAVAGALSAGGIGRLLGSDPSPSEVTRLLHDEGPAIRAALPPGLSPASGGAASGLGAPAEAVAAAGPAISRWLPWLLLAAGVIALLFALRSCGKVEEVTTAPSDVAVETTAAVVIPTGAGVLGEVVEGLPSLHVYFDVAKSDVTKDLGPAASDVTAYLTAHPGSALQVAGFNDPTGNAAANAALSKRRAIEVRDALVAAGIPKAAIKLVKPADTTGTGESNEQSRRVDVTIAK